MKLDAEDWAMFDSKMENHRQWTDRKFDDVHGRITNHEKEYPHHKLLNGGNNGNGRSSYPAVQSDTLRSGSISNTVKLLAGIFAIIVGTASFLAFLKTFMGG